jgi:peptidoglycan biosynthesis protein MviN/MurJ (putative lipid II flippase)
VTVRPAERGTGQQTGGGQRGIGRPALLIGVITAVANVVGFGRQLVFAHTVGTACTATVYATANQVPNIIYAIVLGGALTGTVVPVLAGPASAGARAEARRTASALLTWALLLLVPVSLAVALAARPVASLLLASTPGCPHAAMLPVGSRMLAVFAPQIVLYGLAVVGYGILQAYRRFAPPALAPVLSSVVVAACYAAYVPLSHGRLVGSLPLAAELMLSVGTTAGVAALAVTALSPVARLRLRLRPALHFPPGIAPRVRALALAGLAAVIAQNISTVVVIVLANAHGGSGAFVLYSFGWQVFFVPYAVLAVPIATSAFPVLSASAAGPRPGAAAGEDDAPSGGSTAGGTVGAGDAAAGAGAGTVLADGVAHGDGVPATDGVPASDGVPGSEGGAPDGAGPNDAPAGATWAAAIAGGAETGTAAAGETGSASGGGAGSAAAGEPGAAAAGEPGTARPADGDFDTAVASSTRAAALVSCLGVALLLGACIPAARVFLSHDSAYDRAGARELAWALAAFAPGLAGFGLAANLSRVLFACRRTRIAAVVVTGGWLLVLVADLVLVPLVPRAWVVPALGLGNSVGLTAAGVALVAAVRQARGRAVLRGLTRACVAGLAAAAVGAAAGLGVSAALRGYGFLPNAAVALLACLAVALVFTLAALALDAGEVRSLLARARTRLPGRREAAS